MRPSALGGRGIGQPPSFSSSPPTQGNAAPTSVSSMYHRPTLRQAGKTLNAGLSNATSSSSSVLPSKVSRAPTGVAKAVVGSQPFGTVNSLSSMLKEQRQSLSKKPDSAPVQQRPRPASNVFARLTASSASATSGPAPTQVGGWTKDFKAELHTLPNPKPLTPLAEPTHTQPIGARRRDSSPHSLSAPDTSGTQELTTQDEREAHETVFRELLGRFTTAPPTIGHLESSPKSTLDALQSQISDVRDWPQVDAKAHALLSGRVLERPFSTYWSEGDFQAWRDPSRCVSSTTPGGISWGVFCCLRCRMPVALLQHTHRLAGGFAGFSRYNAPSLGCELHIGDEASATLVVFCRGCNGFLGVMVCESVLGGDPKAPTLQSSAECLKSNFSTLHLVTFRGKGVPHTSLPGVLSDRFISEEGDVPEREPTKVKPPSSVGSHSEKMVAAAPSRSSRMLLEYEDETCSDDSEDFNDSDDDAGYSKSEALHRIQANGADVENGGVTVPRSTRSKYEMVKDYLDEEESGEDEH